MHYRLNKHNDVNIHFYQHTISVGPWMKSSDLKRALWSFPVEGVIILILVATNYSFCSLKSDTFIILFFLKSNNKNGPMFVQSLWNYWALYFFFLDASSDTWLITCLHIWSHLWNDSALPCHLLQHFHLICILPFLNLAVDINLIYFYFKIFNWKTRYHSLHVKWYHIIHKYMIVTIMLTYPWSLRY